VFLGFFGIFESKSFLMDLIMLMRLYFFQLVLFFWLLSQFGLIKRQFVREWMSQHLAQSWDLLLFVLSNLLNTRRWLDILDLNRRKSCGSVGVIIFEAETFFNQLFSLVSHLVELLNF